MWSMPSPAPIVAWIPGTEQKVDANGKVGDVGDPGRTGHLLSALANAVASPNTRPIHREHAPWGSGEKRPPFLAFTPWVPPLRGAGGVSTALCAGQARCR